MYFLVLKKKAILLWMNLKDMMLKEISQAQKTDHPLWSPSKVKSEEAELLEKRPEGWLSGGLGESGATWGKSQVSSGGLL